MTALVEIPSGSRNKYELDKESGLLRLDRVLFSAVHYPGDYGFIPRTLAEDHDPCDILVLVNEPTFPGCQIDARPIGVLMMTDRGEPDDKILAVPINDPFFGEYFDIADIPQHYLKEVEHFFHIYKDLEGKRVQTVGWEKSDGAMRVIREGIERYSGEVSDGDAVAGGDHDGLRDRSASSVSRRSPAWRRRFAPRGEAPASTKGCACRPRTRCRSGLWCRDRGSPCVCPPDSISTTGTIRAVVYGTGATGTSASDSAMAPTRSRPAGSSICSTRAAPRSAVGRVTIKVLHVTLYDQMFTPTGNAGPRYVALARWAATGKLPTVSAYIISRDRLDLRRLKGVFYTADVGVIAAAQVHAARPAAAADSIVDSAAIAMRLVRSNAAPWPLGAVELVLRFDSAGALGSMARDRRATCRTRPSARSPWSSAPTRASDATWAVKLRVTSAAAGFGYQVLEAITCPN